MRLLVVVLSFLFMSVAVADDVRGPVIEYLEMTPKFTVNLAEPRKFLLVNVQLLVNGAEAVESVKKHMPALRHELVMMYSGMRSDELQTTEQREALRQETTAIIRQTLEKMEGKKAEPNKGFQEAYFTEFLVD
ncbi:MAG: flagellar basal body-associated FliL family protein [Methylobacter sp.]|nr:flagellar basal body-associated FliL family protein [Methylobacter sp.]MDP2098746.1 flagellar basal body-associated FliL family protein [Methylobacter sp.]MDP2426525.1 flagellar basal body-associated FliL family protein [Methylobacter sp.]MDP3056208.1 flagellar basal body-associated FliL family protein [Methylobacter sp.]MDP3361496.1 flagellar basal body-associated FliL family protein [Methylobacter sp.]